MNRAIAAPAGTSEARHAYRRALDLTQTEPGQRFLQDRLAETAPSVPSQPGCAST
jgi:RNA polymerase sigma-70 factor (ECF subfamily)